MTAKEIRYRLHKKTSLSQKSGKGAHRTEAVRRLCRLPFPCEPGKALPSRLFERIIRARLANVKPCSGKTVSVFLIAAFSQRNGLTETGPLHKIECD